MTNPNDNKSYREVRQDSYIDSNGETHTNVTRTSETVNNDRVDSQSYRNGYVQGRVSERNYQEDLAQRDTNNASQGLLLGFLIAGLAALTAGAIWYFNRPESAVDNTTTPVETIPATSSPTPAATLTPEPQQTTIIERTREVPVPIPVPEQRTSPVPTPAAPNVNITVPPQQPSSTQTAPTSPSTSNGSTSTTTPTTSPNETITTTPSLNGQDQTDVTPNSNSSDTNNSSQ
jgi:outer membrane biosynthesis protein TonB